MIRRGGPRAVFGVGTPVAVYSTPGVATPVAVQTPPPAGGAR
ncbi:hypothetical protein ACOKM5_10230 [Streptomyces sp. BH097]